MPNKDSELKNMDKQVEELLYGFDSEDQQEKQDLDNLREKIININSSYKDFIKTPNLLEFITQNALNTYNNQYFSEKKLSANKGKMTKQTVESVLENKNVFYLIEGERERTERYNEYRIADSYIPQISKCINLYRDAILAPDDLTKKTINIVYDDPNISKELKLTIEKNFKDLKKKYNLDTQSKVWLRDGLVDGDTFVAILSLSEEINQMIFREDNSSQVEALLTEDFFSELPQQENLMLEDIVKDFTNEINKNDNGKNKQNKNQENFETNEFKQKFLDAFNKNIQVVSNPYDDLKDYVYKNDVKASDKYVKMNGSYVRKLNPERTIVLNIEDIVFGYLYVEKYDINSETGVEGFGNMAFDLMSNYNSSGNSLDYFNSFRKDLDGNSIVKEKLLTDLFVRGISKKLNKKTLEDNIQFKEVIYKLLKKDYLINKRVKITFYSPEQVKHYKCESTDTYGNSKLSKVMFYVKIFLSTLITEAMQKISRGRDKRVVYVETGLEEDIESSIQAVIRDFKTKEIQADYLKSLTTVLNMMGTFEDYYIPKFNGDTPIELETISGMDVSMDNDFMEWLLKSIVSGIGVPNNYTDNSNDIDFAKSLVMQNAPFVREIVSMQNEASEFYSSIVRELYKNEYLADYGNDKSGKKRKRSKNKNINELIDLDKIIVDLPVPEFLNINNINDQISANSSEIEFVVGTYFDDNNSDEEVQKVKFEFKKRVTKSLVTNVDWNKYDGMLDEVLNDINKAKIEEKVTKSNNSEGSEDISDEDLMDY